MTLLGLGVASELSLLSLYSMFASAVLNLLETNTNLMTDLGLKKSLIGIRTEVIRLFRREGKRG